MLTVLRLVPGTLAIASSFVVLAAAFMGIGLLIRRAFLAAAPALDDVLAAFWMGFGAVILFLLLWNFVAPVNAAALVVVVGTGIVGIWSVRRALMALWGASGRQSRWWTLAGVVASTLWIANLATGAMTNWDTTLYHMQGVQWALTYPAIPGIANLFGPLAFNNASLLYDAMVGTGPWAGQGWRVANGLLLAVLAAQAIVGLGRLADDTRPRRAADVFLLFLLPVALDMAMRDEVVSFVTDLSLTAVRMGCMALWYRALTSGRREAEVEAYDVVCIVALSATSVALKMNAAVFSVAAVVTAGALWWTLQRPTPRVAAKTFRWATAIALVYGAAWTGRGYLLSGYPFFPTPLLGASVDWKAPLEHARAEFDYVQHSTRHSTGNLAYVSGERQGMSAWFPNWFSQVDDDVYHVVIPMVLVVALVLLLWWRRGGARNDARDAVHDEGRAAWWLLLPLTFAMVLWFIMAPAPRYAMAFFWCVVGVLAGQVFSRRSLATRVGHPGVLVMFGACLGASPLLVNPTLDWWRAGRKEGLVTILVRADVRIPPPGRWFQPRQAMPNVTPYTTRSGLVVQVPEFRCWDTPVPCTPNPAPNLTLRVPGRIEKGFAVAGAEWQMTDWPENWHGEYFRAWQKSQSPSDTAAR